jgi:hypothetical protein
MRYKIIKKGIVVILILLFIGAAFLPNVCGILKIKNQPTIKSSVKIQMKEYISIKFFVFGKEGYEISNSLLSSDDAIEIIDKFEELQENILDNPISDNTKMLKQDLIILLDKNGLVSQKSSRKEINNLILGSQPTIFQNKFNKLRTNINFLTGQADEKMCVINSNGKGVLFPILFVMLPRPRFFVYWDASEGNSTVMNIFKMMGFEANGQQKGLGLFCATGMGMVTVKPEGNDYWLIAMAMRARVEADIINPFP